MFMDFGQLSLAILCRRSLPFNDEAPFLIAALFFFPPAAWRSKTINPTSAFWSGRKSLSRGVPFFQTYWRRRNKFHPVLEPRKKQHCKKKKCIWRTTDSYPFFFPQGILFIGRDQQKKIFFREDSFLKWMASCSIFPRYAWSWWAALSGSGSERSYSGK